MATGTSEGIHLSEQERLTGVDNRTFKFEQARSVSLTDYVG